MPNHFHLLLCQGKGEKVVSKAMQSLATTYSMYFNRKYNRRGSIFESVFKSSAILTDSYLQHISRYIHFNPVAYKTWKHSSYGEYSGRTSREWIDSEPLLRLFSNKEQYLAFVDDYKELRDELSDLKREPADYGETYHTIK